MALNWSIKDSFRSLLTGLGVPGRDKVASMYPSFETLSQDMRSLEALYRGNWLAKKIVDIPAFDSTRAWRTWDAKQDQVTKLEDAERVLGIQHKMMEALIKSRLYGGSALLLGIKGSKFNEELDIDKVGKGDLKFVHVVEKWMIQAGPRVRDITSPWFGEPSYYMRSNTPTVEAPGGVEKLESGEFAQAAGESIYFHPSRVIQLVGVAYPDMEHAPDPWGDSVLSAIYDAIRDAGLVTQSMANMVADAKVDVFRIPGLTNTLSTQAGTDNLISYLANANVAKSIVNSLIIDKEIEWNRIQTKFEGMPEIMQAYLMVCAAGADIPSTRMLSREPSGQNSTGESDIRNYYDRLSSEQKVILTPKLTRLDEVLIRHALGDRPDEVKYDWNPLWQMSEPEKADIAFKKAQAYKIDVDSALIPAQALVKGRENQLIEDGFYPGLESALDDLKKDWQEEVEFLPMQQLEHQSNMQSNQLEHQVGMQENQLGHQTSMQKNQLTSQEKLAKDKPRNKFGDANRRLALIHNRLYGDVDPVYDEGGISELSFMAPIKRSQRSSKRPFYASDAYYEEQQHPRGSHGRWSSKGSSRMSRYEEAHVYEEAMSVLYTGAIEHASFDETVDLLTEKQHDVLIGRHPNLREYFETEVKEEVKGHEPSIDLPPHRKYLVGYHGTTKEVYEAAKIEGLVPHKSGGADEWAKKHDMPTATQFLIGDRKVSVYMAANPVMAAGFAKIAAEVRGQKPTLLEIHIPAEYVKNAVPDLFGPNDENGAAFLRYKGVIKPEWIARELPFSAYNKGGIAIAHSGTGEEIASHDAKKPLVIYAIVFPLLPMEMHDAEYVEQQHPRGEHGRWSQGYGEAAREFVSPNVHQLDIHQAIRAIGSHHHEQFKRAADQIDAITNAAGVEQSVIGAWKDGAEDSMMIVMPKMSHDDLVLNAAMKGALGRQKSVLVFDDDENGPHQLYHITMPGASLLEAHEELLKAGIEFHTLLPREAGAEVIVVDMDGSLKGKLDNFADGYGASGVVYNGKAEFIGTQKEDGTDDDQRSDAVRQYENIIAHSQSDKRGVWPQLRDRWSGQLRASEQQKVMHP